MGDKKHIDRLFQEHFKYFEVTPDDAVWDKIEAKLNNKKKRRVIPIWWRYAGVAALLILFLSIGYGIFNSNKGNTDTPQVVDSDITEIDNTTIEKETNDGIDIIANDNSKIDNLDNEEEVETKSPPQNNKLEEVKKQLIMTNRASSSIAKTNPSKETINRASTTSNNAKPAIITYKDDITKTDIANTNPSDNEKLLNTVQSLENKTNTVKDKSLIKNNVNVVASDDSNIKTESLKGKVTEDTQVADNNIDEKNTSTESVTKSIEDAIQKNESLLDDKKTEVAFNKWSVAPNVAPVYFNSLGKGSSLDAQFNENTKTGEVNMSYGINASYAINKRLKIRSGVNRVNLGFNTNDVVVLSSVDASANSETLSTFLSSTVANNGTEGLSTSAGDGVSIVSASSFRSNDISTLATSNTSINESFGFIEIPFELQYAISTKRFGVNVIGGFSSLFLSDYEALTDIEGQRTRILETDNINNTSYSANFGLGLNYKVSDKINLNLEPMFKYQINTFKNTSGDFQPFFIGVYTGFGIKF